MKIFTGKVISTKNQKTAVAVVERVIVHPVYKKRFKRTKKFQIHDELGALVGQTVKFVASRPYSKTKKWKVVEIIKEANKPLMVKDLKTKKVVKTKSKKI